MNFAKICTTLQDNNKLIEFSFDLTKDIPNDIDFTNDTIPLFTNFGTDILSNQYVLFYENALSNICNLCDKSNTVVISPSRHSILRSGKAISDFLVRADRDNLFVLLSPAQLLTNSSEDEMFYALDGHIYGIYATDIDLTTDKIVTLGEGDVSWTTVLTLLSDHCPDGTIYLPDTDRYTVDCDFLRKLDEVACRMLG